ncbi:MAG: CopG family transcriptional regulator [Alphaproteobacteria bacterium]|nr:CopG family transcriptional regulator [Alphaproteobacteria bacterium]
MKKKIKYTNEPLGEITIIKDFLPKPKDLIFREEMIEVKIPLSRRSLEFFTKQGKKHHIAPERMISALAESYTEKYE